MNGPTAISHTERFWKERADYWCKLCTKAEAGETVAKAEVKRLNKWCNGLSMVVSIEFVALVCAAIWIFGQVAR